jgi:hypothetical protein
LQIGGWWVAVRNFQQIDLWRTNINRKTSRSNPTRNPKKIGGDKKSSYLSDCD